MAKNMLCSLKNDLGLTTFGVYQVSCECEVVYIGQTGCTIEVSTPSGTARPWKWTSDFI